MKYIYYFKESVESNSFFENDHWIVTKLAANDYLIKSKVDDEEYSLDFNRDEYYDKDDEEIYIKEFLDENNDLYHVIGDDIKCNFIFKDGDDYWVVVSVYEDFESYFKSERNRRDDYIKKVLSGDAYEIFSYSSGDFDISEDIDADDEVVLTLKIILRLKQYEDEDGDDYEYDVADVKDYSDVVSIVREYGFDDLKKLLKRCICVGHENADADEAYKDLTNSIYDSFNLQLGSAKWQKINPTDKYEALWIKFKDKGSAIYAKFIINNPNNDWDDDKIDFSTPYYGYSGDRKTIIEVFNNEFHESMCDYFSDECKEITKIEELWKEMSKESDFKEEKFWDDINMRLDAKKYNL